jgi:type I restriction enzyme S subunit
MNASWPNVPLKVIIRELEAGVSVNGIDEPVCGNDDVGVLKVSCVSRGRFIPTENKKVVPEDVRLVAVSPRAGDIIISRANTFDLVGTCGYVTEDHPNLFLSDKLWRVRLRDPQFDSSQWLIALLDSTMVRREFYRRATGTSGSMKNISKESLLAIRVPRPSHETQLRLGATFEQVEALRHLLERAQAAKRMLKRGLMQQLLSGKKRFARCADGAWRSVPLGDVLTYVPRKVSKPVGTFLSAGVRSHGKGVFLKGAFPSDGIALEELFVLRHLDLVVNITFGWEGALAIVPPEADGALVSHRFPTYEFDRTRALPEYFRHLIQMKRFVFDVACASPGGAGRNRVLNRRQFLEIPVTLPSVEEQHLIATILNRLDGEIDLLKQLQQLLELTKRGLLSRLIVGEISAPA